MIVVKHQFIANINRNKQRPNLSIKMKYVGKFKKSIQTIPYLALQTLPLPFFFFLRSNHVMQDKYSKSRALGYANPDSWGILQPILTNHIYTLKPYPSPPMAVQFELDMLLYLRVKVRPTYLPASQPLYHKCTELTQVLQGST